MLAGYRALEEGHEIDVKMDGDNQMDFSLFTCADYELKLEANMTPDDARLYVLSLYRNLLKRDPEPAEFAHWVKVGQDESRPETLFYAVVNSEEYKFNSKVSSQFPTGHHYSAVVDPATVGGYVKKERHTDLMGILGIEVPLSAMEEFWRRSSGVIARTPFQDAKTSRHRILL